MIGTILTAVLPTVSDVLKRIIPDPAQRLEVEREVQAAIIANEASIFKAASETIQAEASSGNWLASSWRPILMYFFMIIMGWIVIAATFGDATPITSALAQVPDNLWNMLMLGMGGYILGRSGEKIVDRWASREG